MDFFAWIANILVFIYKLPQIYTLYKVRDTTGLSVYSFCIQATSYILYILHGYFVNDISLLYGMILPLAQNIIVIIMYQKIVAQNRREKNQKALNHSSLNHPSQTASV